MMRKKQEDNKSLIGQVPVPDIPPSYNLKSPNSPSVYIRPLASKFFACKETCQSCRLAFPIHHQSFNIFPLIKPHNLMSEHNLTYPAMINFAICCYKQETDALLKEWQRLSVQRYSLCPPCTQKKKPAPCLFRCNWMSSAASKLSHGTQKKMCKGSRLYKGEKFNSNLIFPPPGKK